MKNNIGNILFYIIINLEKYIFYVYEFVIVIMSKVNNQEINFSFPRENANAKYAPENMTYAN